jgi:prephenate dehydrogenase
MKSLIVGLGLMGGAYALRLKDKGHTVYGVDINENSIKFAKDNNYIDEGSTNPMDYIEKSDLIILCIYPQAILNFIKTYNDIFKEGQVVTDICGVKESFVEEVSNLINNASYCSHHPMAGKEKVGVEYSHLCRFDDANYLVTTLPNTNKQAIEVVENLGYDLGFKNISIISTKRHDSVVGFTSQLTHAIAVSLVNSDRDSDTKNFIGDSYRDLTRIAMINESLWSELFLENKDNLLKHIISFEIELNEIKKALLNNDKKRLEELFKSSTKIRKEMEK